MPDSNVPALTLPSNIAARVEAAISKVDERNLIESFLANKAETTRKGYESDLRHFAKWLNLDDIDQAAAAVMSGSSTQANQILLAWQSDQLEQGLSAATINRRASALKALVKLGRMLGKTNVVIDVPGLKRETLRDTRGPGVDALRSMVAAIKGRKDGPEKVRDLAIFRLLTSLALRRGEASSLDVGDLEGGRVWIKKKGKREKKPFTIPDQVASVIMDWLKRYHPNPEPDQPMFVCLRGPGTGGRLSGSGIYKLIRRLGKEAGVDAPVRPHGIRHSAVTSALDLRDGDVRAVRHFSSHANLDVLLVYDDARQDFAGEISKEVDAEIWGATA